jgi:predicted cobalt transporter CbtA
MSVVLISGTLAGILLFLLQRFTISSLIEKAEVYEAAAEQRKPGMHHEDEGWQPANGAERMTLTVVATVLAGIGFAGLLFGTAAIKPVSLDLRKRDHRGISGLRVH